MENRVEYFVIVALAIPLSIYIWAAYRTPKSMTDTLPNYYIAFRKVDSAPYANASLAYAFQVATLFPFLYWGVQGQILPAIVNAICWGLGIFIFRFNITHILALLNKNVEPHTLHGILGNYYKSALVQKTSATVTIVGMIGVALAEAYWGMQILRVLVPEDTPTYYAIVLATLLFVLIYIWYGGTWGSMKTDMLQLVFSYIGFTGVFLFAISIIFLNPSLLKSDMGIIYLLMFIGGAVTVFVRINKNIAPIVMISDNSSSNTEVSNEQNKLWNILFKTLSVATIAAIGALSISFGWLFIQSFPKLSFKQLMNPGDPNWHGIIALSIMASFYQFVDMSAWQRLQSLGGSSENAKYHASKGLLLYGIESSFSWLMCISLGIVLVTIIPELSVVTDKAGPLAAIPRILLSSGSIVRIIVALLFMIAVMGVMLSTIDSALLATMYAYTADIRQYSFKNIDIEDKEAMREKRHDLLESKKSAFWIVLLICFGVVFLGWILKTPDKLIGVMVGFYGAMLSMFPAIIFMIKNRKGLSGIAIAWGIIFGILGSLTFTTWGLFDSDRAWDAVFVGPGLALLITELINSFVLKKEAINVK